MTDQEAGRGRGSTAAAREAYAETWSRERYGKGWAGRVYAPHWENWLYERHSRDELAGWARRSDLFRYCRAHGGHIDDGDDLRVAIRIGTEADLVAALGVLGIRPVHVPEDAPRPVPGVSYSAARFRAFPDRITAFPHLAQPGWVRVAGQRVWVHARAGQLELRLFDAYEVTEAQVAAAEAVEPLLGAQGLGDCLIDPPEDSPHCLCPRFYPGLWPTR
ncbi:MULTISPECIES: hypothetical protein [unclassified Streptomyces]|uniref:hypothetical protein n=1 Tax=unclassified Streptomyces TaxID=2593676 RepID=UPI000DADB7A2|nr:MULTISPECIES: hypothetical protein [unclassified Streptomyces]PZT73780.1 hypothetical protein DNK55_16295 [Streptomyces sp. AC1-42T]PZT83224.1 hypothetical protein DNK56_15130 [Streptomyces sp. AC1-42W]